MNRNYKILLCERSTGHILNIDATTLFSNRESSELPYIYFESFAEAKSFASELISKLGNLEIVIYKEEKFMELLHSK